MRAAFIFSFIALCALNVVVYSSEIDEFESYIQKYSKTYANVAEKTKKMVIYLQNKVKVNKMNAESKRNKQNVVFEINRFSDLTNEEFLAKYTGYKSIDPSRIKRDVHLVIANLVISKI